MQASAQAIVSPATFTLCRSTRARVQPAVASNARIWRRRIWQRHKSSGFEAPLDIGHRESGELVFEGLLAQFRIALHHGRPNDADYRTGQNVKAFGPQAAHGRAPDSDVGPDQMLCDSLDGLCQLQ